MLSGVHYIFLALMFLSPYSFSEMTEGETDKPMSAPTLNVALYDEIIIDRSLEEVWKELIDFPFWFFSGEGIKRIEGKPGKMGDTALTENLYTEIIAVRPLQNITWKASVKGSHDHVYFDLKVEDVKGRTRFSKHYYIQGFWPEKMLLDARQTPPKGELPDFLWHISLAFKAYLETGASRKDYLKNQKDQSK